MDISLDDSGAKKEEEAPSIAINPSEFKSLLAVQLVKQRSVS